MTRLIYFTMASLDGYTSDASGDFEWAMPDEEVHAYINDLERPVGTYLYGRRMYETMVYWETAPTGPDTTSVERDYTSIWRAAIKVVYSTTLHETSSARTRIEHRFDPVAVRELKATSATDLAIGGPELAGRALANGLVDEIHLIIVPVLVGGGQRALPDDVRRNLVLLDEHRFTNGMLHVTYQVTPS